MVKFLTPHLANSLPELASAIPYLLAIAGLTFLMAVAAGVCLVRFHSRLTIEHTNALIAKNWPSTLRRLERRLQLGRLLLLAFPVLTFVVWMALVWTGNADPMLSEIFFVVIYIGLIVPAVFGLLVLKAAFRISAEQLELKRSQAVR